MAEHIALTEEMLRSHLELKEYTLLKERLTAMNCADIAAVLGELEADRLSVAFRLLPKELAAETFAEMEPHQQETLIQAFSDSELHEVINELYVDDAADLVEEMPANVVKRILAQTDPAMRGEINEILRYPEDSAGALMTTEFVSLQPEMTVAEAISRIRRTGVEKETIYTCYVTDRRVLTGVVTIKDLLLCPDDERKVAELMDENVISVTTSADREDVANALSHYNFIALPVVDNERRMVGIVTFDDAMDVIAQEATEDIEKMGGIVPSDKSYLRSNPTELFLRRIPWLMLLMVSATFTGMIITGYENALARMVVLTSFIPMLMDTGGNSGSQSSVTVIRALSLGELEFCDILVVIWKEIRTAVLCGAALAALCFAKIMLVDRLLLGNPDINVSVALVICITMLVTVIVAKIVGSTLPLLAKKAGFDPAVMASPFITTIVDAISLVVYFNIATALLF